MLRGGAMCFPSCEGGERLLGRGEQSQIAQFHYCSHFPSVLGNNSNWEGGGWKGSRGGGGGGGATVAEGNPFYYLINISRESFISGTERTTLQDVSHFAESSERKELDSRASLVFLFFCNYFCVLQESEEMNLRNGMFLYSSWIHNGQVQNGGSGWGSETGKMSLSIWYLVENSSLIPPESDWGVSVWKIANGNVQMMGRGRRMQWGRK